MILLTLERKYLKVEQSFAQSSFHIKSLLSLCGGWDGGPQWMSRYTNYASLQPTALQQVFVSSHLHILMSHTCSSLQRKSQNNKTRQVSII